MKRFVMTEEHIKLLRRAVVGWQDCEAGAPEIDPKRPYGNSDVEHDVATILGWERLCRNDKDGSTWFSAEQEERAFEIHRQTEHALQIYLQHGAAPGEYTQRRFGEWEPA